MLNRWCEQENLQEPYCDEFHALAQKIRRHGLTPPVQQEFSQGYEAAFPQELGTKGKKRKWPLYLLLGLVVLGGWQWDVIKPHIPIHFNFNRFVADEDMPVVAFSPQDVESKWEKDTLTQMKLTYLGTPFQMSPGFCERVATQLNIKAADTDVERNGKIAALLNQHQQEVAKLFMPVRPGEETWFKVAQRIAKEKPEKKTRLILKQVW